LENLILPRNRYSAHHGIVDLRSNTIVVSVDAPSELVKKPPFA